MKFCSECGTQMQDSDMFCSECGAKSAPAADIPPESVIGVINPAVTPRQSMLRSVVGSKWMRTMAISATACFVLSLISTILSTALLSHAFDNLLDYYYYYGYSGDFSQAYAFINAFTHSTSITSYIFIILSFAAMWSIYRWAHNPNKIAPAGFTMLKVVCVFDLIKLCAIALLLVLAEIVTVIAASVTGEYEMIITASILSVVIILLMLFYVFAITYDIKWFRMLSGAGEICRTGTTFKKPSSFLVVINCILIGFMSLSFIASLIFAAIPSNLIVNMFLRALYQSSSESFINVLRPLLSVGFPPFYIKIWTLLASAANIVSLISQTVLLSKYNSGLNSTK